MEDLTAIQPYSGWRSSATGGEAEALDYVTETLGQFEHHHTSGRSLRATTRDLDGIAWLELWVEDLANP
jgi:hypothetical protein